MGDELLWDQQFVLLDTDRDGLIDANLIVPILRKSELPDAILAKVWQAANPQNRPKFDKAAFIAAMRMVTQARQAHLAQSGDAGRARSASMPAYSTPPQNSSTSSQSSSTKPIQRISAPEKAKYVEIFKTLNPVNGFVSGDQVKPIFLSSRLPMQKLEKIWLLADIDHDGQLDVEEFVVAMRLIYSTLNGEIPELPSVLPAELLPESKSTTTVSTNPVPIKEDWTLSAEDRERFTKLYRNTCKQTFLTEAEAKEVFTASKLPAAEFSQIWSLIKASGGSIDLGQFLAFMSLITARRKGVALPTTLPSQLANLLTETSGIRERSKSVATPIASTPVQPPAPPVTQVRNDAALIAELEKQLEEEKALMASVLERQKLLEQRRQTADAQLVEYETFHQELQGQLRNERKDLAMLETRLRETEEELKRHNSSLAGLIATMTSLQEQQQRLQA